jgi:hypothetical protein
MRPSAGVPPSKRPPGKSPKNRKWRRRALVGIVVLMMLAGVGFIVGSYFYDSIHEPGELKMVNNTEIFASNGTTQLARLGSLNRVEVPLDRLSPQVQKALIAGEDKNFYQHHGIDISGVARAAWNNLTGGQTQGGSTITQQYARQAAGDLEISYARKLREAVMARKLENNYTKEQILGFYLNTVYFGRGAHGIGAAAEAYFAIAPERIDTLTVPQAAVLGARCVSPKESRLRPGEQPPERQGPLGLCARQHGGDEVAHAGRARRHEVPAACRPGQSSGGELQKLDHSNAGAPGVTTIAPPGTSSNTSRPSWKRRVCWNRCARPGSATGRAPGCASSPASTRVRKPTWNGSSTAKSRVPPCGRRSQT